MSHHRRWPPWGRIISGTVGYVVFALVVQHFLSIAKSEDHVLDGIRAGAGVLGLQVGIGKESIIKTVDAFTRFFQAIPSWWRAKTGLTAEHAAAPAILPLTKPKRSHKKKPKSP